MDDRKGSHGGGRGQDMTGQCGRGRGRVPMPSMDFPPIMVSPITFDCRDYIGSPNHTFVELTLAIILQQNLLPFRLHLRRSYHREYQFLYRLTKVRHPAKPPFLLLI